MLIGHAARIEPLIIPCHTAQYFLEYTTESWKEKKSQAMSFNNTRTVRGIYPGKIMILKIVSAREKF